MPWRDLPERFGNPISIHMRFSRWAKSGVWKRLFEMLATDADNEYAMIDSTIVRAHQHSAGAQKVGEDQAIGRSKGGLSTKIHAMVDALGNPVSFFLTPGQAHDLDGADALLPQMNANILLADFKRAAAVNTNWPLHKLSALDDLKAECIRRDHWREEGSHIRRGHFPPAMPEVAIRELSVQDDGDGITYLKIEPLHAPTVVYETGSAEPTRASTPVPTPTRFEATGLRYRFLAVDPNDLARCSPIKDWTAKLRLKYQIHDRGDHYEIELLALPKANGIVIHYTTDGSAPKVACPLR